jgi:alpha-tubulin suppressor-like RCC1 family protein
MLLRLCVLAVLSVGLLFAPGAAQATASETVVAWGCEGAAWGCTPVPAAATSGVTAIAAGAFHSLALKEDGSVVAWGCGEGRDLGQCTVPAAATGGVTAISAGNYQSLALKQDGSVLAWGCGVIDWGQCSVPAAAATGVTAIAAGYAQSLALKDDGSVLAWGCGIDNVGQCTVPAAATSGVTAISAGDYHSLALKQDGSVVAWGCTGLTSAGQPSDYGQCTVPAAATSGVIAIAAGHSHSLALKEDGSVLAWGCGTNGGFNLDWGQCTVPAAATSGVTAIAAGTYQSLALKQDGAVIAWGCSGSGFGPCAVPAAAATSTAIAASYSHSLALSEPLGQTKADQTIAFGPLANKSYGDPDFSVSAGASSGLAVSFAASGNCTFSGATVHLTGAGSCAVTASQPGDASYNPAPAVSRSFAIAKAGQSIIFGPLPNKTYGAPDFTVSATASSGLPVSFAASGKCTVTAASVHLAGAGSCTMTASQPGNVNYNPAPAVSRSFSIKRPPCRVPKAVGRRLGAAKKLIAKRHCRTGKLGHAYSRTRKKGFVISQSRRPGRVLPANAKINLVVSRGRRR